MNSKRRSEPDFSFVRFSFAYVRSFCKCCLGFCVVTWLLLLYLVLLVPVVLFAVKIISEMTYNVSSGMLNLTIPIALCSYEYGST